MVKLKPDELDEDELFDEEPPVTRPLELVELLLELDELLVEFAGKPLEELDEEALPLLELLLVDEELLLLDEEALDEDEAGPGPLSGTGLGLRSGNPD